MTEQPQKEVGRRGAQKGSGIPLREESGVETRMISYIIKR